MDVVVWLIIGANLVAGFSFDQVVRHLGLTPTTPRSTPHAPPSSGAVADARARLGDVGRSHGGLDDELDTEVSRDADVEFDADIAIDDDVVIDIGGDIVRGKPQRNSAIALSERHCTWPQSLTPASDVRVRGWRVAGGARMNGAWDLP